MPTFEGSRRGVELCHYYERTVPLFSNFSVITIAPGLPMGGWGNMGGGTQGSSIDTTNFTIPLSGTPDNNQESSSISKYIGCIDVAVST